MVSNSRRLIIPGVLPMGLPIVLRRNVSILVRNRFSLKKFLIVLVILSLLSYVLKSFLIYKICSTTFTKIK
jgi:hypothetical protein